VEIGGTFTDLVAVDDEGAITTCKVLSTPKAPEQGALGALGEWGRPMDGVGTLVHGSTVATNAVVTRRGAVTALLTTVGFRDVLEIQRHEKSRVYDLFYQKPQPLVPRHRVLEVNERLAADGNPIRPVSDVEELVAALARLVAEDRVESVAVVLLHAYQNPVHELALREILRQRFPGLTLTLSSEVLPEFREYERASTTVMSAYLKPVIERYMGTMASGLSRMGFTGDFHIMQSNGGVFPVEAAQQQAVNVILSGPAAGVVGATYAAGAAGYANIITFDMGGTSTDVCLVRDGMPIISTENGIDGLPIKVPMIEIISVGAGGGSIAWMDAGGMLKVGPQSAGADPGPCCYGKGGAEPTTTDANLLRGLIRPTKFFGGKLHLRTDEAESAVARLAGKLGMDVLGLAEGIGRVANSNMVHAIRLVSIERGHDPRDYTLVAFGGAGGLHACHLADELHMQTVLIPEFPGLLSAFGLLASDFKRDLVQTELTREREIRVDRVLEVFGQMAKRAREEFERYRVGHDALRLITSIDLRYLGQAFALSVPVDLARIRTEGLTEPIAAFHAAYDKRCGHCFPDEEVQLVNYRVSALVPQQAPVLRRKPASVAPAAEMGKVYLDGRWVSCAHYDREALPAGFTADGPVVVEEATATTFVPPTWRLTVDPWGNLVLTKAGR
jgi:N-methylhydantoinase A